MKTFKNAALFIITSISLAMSLSSCTADDDIAASFPTPRAIWSMATARSAALNLRTVRPITTCRQLRTRLWLHLLPLRWRRGSTLLQLRECTQHMGC